MEEKLNKIEKLCLEFKSPIVYSENSDLVLNHIKKSLMEREEKDFKAKHTLFLEKEEFVNEKYNLLMQLEENYV